MALHGLKVVEFCRIPRSEAAGEFSSALLKELKKGGQSAVASPSEFRGRSLCTLAFGLGLAHAQENVERSAEGDELAAMQAERRQAVFQPPLIRPSSAPA